MADLPTRTELFNIGADDLIARASARPGNRQASAEEIFTPGSDLNLLIAASSAMAEEIVRQLGRSAQDLTLDGAQDEGGALERFVADRFGTSVVRKQPAPALVTLQFSRTSIAAGAQIYESGSRVSTAGGIQFELTTSASFPSTSFGPITALARAVDAGISGNVSANTITQFVTAPTDTTISVTNPSFASGGDDLETAPRFRERARLFPTSREKGTLTAIEFGALTVDGVRQATAEDQVGPDGPTARVNLFIADANGQASSQLIALVQTALLEFRAGGIGVDIFGAIPTFVTIQLSLGFEANIDTTAAFDQVRQVIVSRVNELDPQETLYRSLISDAARSINGVIVRSDSIVAPVGDLVPAAGQILRTRADLVTAV